MQYDLDTEEVKTVLLDKKNTTLKFTTSPITGVNIIDNLLFWTDGVNEPKKINISKSTASDYVYLHLYSLETNNKQLRAPPFFS